MQNVLTPVTNKLPSWKMRLLPGTTKSTGAVEEQVLSKTINEYVLK